MENFDIVETLPCTGRLPFSWHGVDTLSWILLLFQYKVKMKEVSTCAWSSRNGSSKSSKALGLFWGSKFIILKKVHFQNLFWNRHNLNRKILVYSIIQTLTPCTFSIKYSVPVDNDLIILSQGLHTEYCFSDPLLLTPWTASFESTIHKLGIQLPCKKLGNFVD